MQRGSGYGLCRETEEAVKTCRWGHFILRCVSSFSVCNILKRSRSVFGDLLCVMWGVAYINGLSCSLFRRGIYFGYVRFVIKGVRRILSV